MSKWLAALPLLACLVVSGRSTLASPDYPAELASDLGLSHTPPCSVCHLPHEPVDSDGSPGADTLFAQALLSRGLAAGGPAALRSALAQMDGVDSDGDGARDLDELYWGGDPNARDGPTAVSEPPPSYGCQFVENVGPQAQGLWGIGWTALFITRFLSRRRVSCR
jgi:hypothetical protein